jgi:hypothetical protein
MKKYLSIVIASLMVSPAAIAATYTGEASVFYTHGTESIGFRSHLTSFPANDVIYSNAPLSFPEHDKTSLPYPEYDTPPEVLSVRQKEKESAVILQATHYYEPVYTGAHVLGEAAFLERSGKAYLQFVSSSWESSSTTKGGEGIAFSKGDGDTRVAAVGMDGWLFKKFVYVSLDYAFEGSARSKSNSYFKLIDDNTQQSQEWFKEKYDAPSVWGGTLGVSPFSGLLISSTFIEDRDPKDWYSLDVKYVREFDQRAINVEAHFEDSDGDSLWKIGGDYYFHRMLSVGLSFQEDEKSLNHRINDKNGVFTTLSTQYFINDGVALSGAYTFASDYNGFNVGVTGRY